MQANDRAETDEDCDPACGGWPNVIIGIQPTNGHVAVTVETSSGWRGPAIEGGCPVGFDTTRYLCSFTTFTTAADTSVAILATVDGTALPEHTLDLRPHNFCARDVAYAELEFADTGPAWRNTVFLNPCSGE